MRSKKDFLSPISIQDSTSKDSVKDEGGGRMVVKVEGTFHKWSQYRSKNFPVIVIEHNEKSNVNHA